MSLLPSQDINPASNASVKLIGERYGKEARDRYALEARRTNFIQGNSRKFGAIITFAAGPRLSTNAKYFSPEGAKKGGGIDQQLLRAAIQKMKQSHFEIGKPQHD